MRKLFRWFRKLQLWATGDWQLHHNNVPTRASFLMQFFGETPNHPGDLVPLQPIFGALWLLAFPKTKVTFEREEISDHWWNSGKHDRAADGDWENYVRSQGAYFEGDWGVTALSALCLVSCIFFNKCLYFSYYMTGYLLDRPCISLNIPLTWGGQWLFIFNLQVRKLQHREVHDLHNVLQASQ